MQVRIERHGSHYKEFAVSGNKWHGEAGEDKCQIQHVHVYPNICVDIHTPVSPCILISHHSKKKKKTVERLIYKNIWNMRQNFSYWWKGKTARDWNREWSWIFFSEYVVLKSIKTNYSTISQIKCNFLWLSLYMIFMRKKYSCENFFHADVVKHVKSVVCNLGTHCGLESVSLWNNGREFVWGCFSLCS